LVHAAMAHAAMVGRRNIIWCPDRAWLATVKTSTTHD
jgi:hypothetical protein